MDRSFYQNFDFKYPEIGVCLENTTGPTVKIAIPIATPTLPMSMPYDNRDLYVLTNNIVSDQTAMYIAPCTVSNYITMRLPSDIKSLSAGDKVILIFIGGDINKPTILRRYEEDGNII